MVFIFLMIVWPRSCDRRVRSCRAEPVRLGDGAIRCNDQFINSTAVPIVTDDDYDQVGSTQLLICGGRGAKQKEASICGKAEFRILTRYHQDPVLAPIVVDPLALKHHPLRGNLPLSSFFSSSHPFTSGR